MVDLYITSKDFEDNLIRETKIGELIKNNKVRILLADKDSEAVNQIVASEKCLSHNCYIKLYYQGGKASNPMPGLEMMNAFKEQNGTVICRQLKGMDDGIVKRSCIDCVKDACVFLEEQLTCSEDQEVSNWMEIAMYRRWMDHEST